MNIRESGSDLILENVRDFNVEQIFECGQCFHFNKIAHMDYVTVAYGRMLRISQRDDVVTFHNTTLKEYEEIWKNYFDMDTDYSYIKETLINKDDRLKEAITKKYGIRILRQEFHEMLMSFIISQNKQIPHIKKIVADICERYGTYVGEVDGTSYYSFPDLEALRNISEDEFRQLKTGFRAPYLINAIDNMANGLTRDSFIDMSYDEAKDRLTSIKGVGDKVANCVLLFGLSYCNAFPVDVWVKRIMEQVYFKEDTPKDVIMKFAEDNFGEYGGYAQQYLFYYGRDMKMQGKKGKLDN